jgi:hypothetical protein
MAYIPVWIFKSPAAKIEKYTKLTNSKLNYLFLETVNNSKSPPNTMIPALNRA